MYFERVTEEDLKRIVALRASSYRPKPIRDLTKEINGLKRVGELHFSVNGMINPELIQKIVGLMLRLDGLYLDWVKGRIN